MVAFSICRHILVIMTRNLSTTNSSDLFTLMECQRSGRTQILYLLAIVTELCYICTEWHIYYCIYGAVCIKTNFYHAKNSSKRRTGRHTIYCYHRVSKLLSNRPPACMEGTTPDQKQECKLGMAFSWKVLDET